MACLLVSACTSGSPLEQGAATGPGTASIPLWSPADEGHSGPLPQAAAPWPAPGSRIAAPDAVPGKFPEHWPCLDTDLSRNGEGLCEWGIFGIDLYRAALYTERRVSSLAETLAAPQSCVIHLQFLRRLTAAQLREAFSAATKVNTGEDFRQFEASLQLLLEAMREVANGDTYSFYCVPSRGMLVVRNGEVLQAIPGDSFRELFLTLYLGENPPTKPLRDGLLGRA